MTEQELPQKSPLAGSILIAGLIVGLGFWGSGRAAAPRPQTLQSVSSDSDFGNESAALPVDWGDLGEKLVSVGVIDERSVPMIVEPGDEQLLRETIAKPLRLTRKNARSLLNIFWALGLGNRSAVLDRGEMREPRYGGPGNFASTAGWTAGAGGAMDHFSMHRFMTLTPEEEALVDRVARGIYRPCCDNSTHFPDCNHGMAMLGLLELLASEGKTESELYAAALTANTFWFPDTYETIDAYLRQTGRSLAVADPKEVLGTDFSSASGFRRIAATAPRFGEGGGCTV